MSILLLIVGLLVAGAVVKRRGALHPLSLFSIYHVVCCLVLYLIVATQTDKNDFIVNGVYLSAMPMYGLESAVTPAVAFFVFLIGMAYVAQVGVTQTTGAQWKLDNRARAVGAAIQGRTGLVALLFVIAACVAHFLSMDHAVLWRNNEYLLIKTPEGVGLTSVTGRLFHTIFRYVGLICVIGAAVFAKRGMFVHAGAAAIVATYAALILLAGSSRWVPLYFSILAAYWLYAKGLRSVISLRFFVTAMLTIISFALVLEGRTNPSQGFSQIMVNLSRLSTESLTTYMLGFLVNVFEGGLNFANSWIIAPDFSDRYKWLSFSPLVSAIDGFDQIRDSDKSKFAPHVPMSGYGEAWFFGIGFLVVFLAAYWWLMRLSASLRPSGRNPVELILTVVVTFTFVYMANYSFRSSWRLVLFLIVCLLIYGRLKKEVSLKSKSPVGALKSTLPFDGS